MKIKTRHIYCTTQQVQTHRGSLLPFSSSASSANKYMLLPPSSQLFVASLLWSTDLGRQHHMCSNRKSNFHDEAGWTKRRVGTLLEYFVFQFFTYDKLQTQHSFSWKFQAQNEKAVRYQNLCHLHVVYSSRVGCVGCLVARLRAIKQPSHCLLKSTTAR